MEMWDLPCYEPFPFPVVALIPERDLLSPSKKLFKGGSLAAADERTGAGRNISSASVPVLYFAHTWRVLEYKRNHLYTFGYQRSSQSKSGTLQKLAFYQEVTDNRNKALSPLPSSNWKETLQLHLVCAGVHNGESKDWRGDSSQHYSAFHNYQTMIISGKEIPFI